MDLFSTFVGQVAFFATTLAIGFGAYKFKFIDDVVLKGTSKLMMNIIIPLLILTVVANSGTRAELISVWPFFIAGILMYAIHFVIGFASTIPLGLKQPEKNCHICMTSYTNTSMFGYPVLMALFPENAGFYIAAYAIVEITLIWTVGVVLLLSAKGERGINVKRIFSPITVGLIIGIAMIMFDIHPQGSIVWDTLTGIGATMKYVGVLFIGGDMAKRGFGAIFRNKKVFSTIPIKLIIMPLAVFFILRNVPILNTEMLLSITVYSMLPTMLTMTIIAQDYDAAADYASATTLLTTLCSVFTMPVVFRIVTSFV
jgi:predicted permease